MLSARLIVIITCWLSLVISCAPALKTVSSKPVAPKSATMPSPLPSPPAKPAPDLKTSEKTETAPIQNNLPSPTGMVKETEKPDEFVFQEETPEPSNGNSKALRPGKTLEEALDFCEAAQDFWQKGEPENAIEALDKAYDLILAVEPGDDPALSQQKEDIRFMISKRILEIYASQRVAANGKNNGIPLEVNHDVQAEIDSFSIGAEKDIFIESYQRSGIYRPYIMEAFRKAGIPPELSWMPLIESGFKVNAFSKARALGLWQFISSTGYKFGLKRSTFVDERLDPIKSTEAAIAYLKELHEMFGDWTTVMAAYNCGEHRILRVIQEQNVNYLDNFWDLYQRLPRETARYVPRFLATLYMVTHPTKYGLDAIRLDPPMAFETATIAKQVHIRNVAEKIGVSESKLKALNPELRYQVVPPSPYALRVPPGKKELLLAAIDAVPDSDPPRPEYISHRVSPGENLSTIARRYHLTRDSIAEANDINRSKPFLPGNLLKIPQKGAIVYHPRVKGTSPQETNVTHVVKFGDTLWTLAQKYKTTMNAIRELNGLSGAQLTIGQALKISSPEGGTSEVTSLRSYKVRKGDTPYNVATRFKMQLEQFLRVNRLTPKSRIYPGQTLYIQ
ncbi:MAG: lytic transglycosylase [Desulfobacterales bacterium CG23_combo_of_CG06-09_8_20_14_all_52_9]|nr:MAG: lytic transglycosylase [Desulfobacterales bacterium CG23_combo_of_CG06-09_8_20_14_all_52_9]